MPLKLLFIIILFAIVTIIFKPFIPVIKNISYPGMIFGIVVLFFLYCFICSLLYTIGKIKKGNGSLKKIVGFILVTVGVSGFLGSMLIYLWGELIPRNIQIPIQSPYWTSSSTIAIDKLGRICIGVPDYRRILFFNKSGKFIESWCLPEGSKLVAIHADSNGFLNAYIAKRKITYNLEGKILINQINQESYEDHRTLKKRITFDNKGKQYILKGLLYPRVDKVDINGKSKIFIIEPIYIWLFTIPFPTLIFGIVGISIVNQTMVKGKKGKAK